MDYTNYEPRPCLGMKPGCVQAARAFLQSRTGSAEQIDFLFHMQECPDCRHFMEQANLALLRRDRIAELLRKGGSRGSDD